MSFILRLLNIPAMVGHMIKRHGTRSTHDPADDLELALYSKLLNNNFLHFGYFKNPEQNTQSISLADFKQAMSDYADLLVSRVKPSDKVLEVGCGMGGLLAKLDAKNIDVSGLTPDISQATHIGKNWPHIPLHNCMLEDLDTAEASKYDVIINSESFQYIDPKSGIEKIDQLLAPGGTWIMTDYFRLRADTHNKSGHIWDAFETALNNGGFEIVENVDITKNVLPTLRFAHLLATKLALPVADFTAQKFFRRHSFFEYLFAPLVNDKLSNVRLGTIDADVFVNDKKYLLLSIKRRA